MTHNHNLNSDIFNCYRQYVNLFLEINSYALKLDLLDGFYHV